MPGEAIVRVSPSQEEVGLRVSLWGMEVGRTSHGKAVATSFVFQCAAALLAQIFNTFKHHYSQAPSRESLPPFCYVGSRTLTTRRAMEKARNHG